ncbi:translation initiation factor IF-2 [Adlercreutzia faecimuris]|uniref:Translation initiation factor IF-2 n=1 Tax=Adlercreutzia faecimuris TaxID=2897341 RepID=A0ABS9WGM4_9ACTN|nr:translation initiation factor IF-2 [Adlercreutzia sp. JBNU-10]MCI2242013.1 translation initiation factor IF-2 [Adlercreutzia sp. JBNU-10]
MGSMRVHELAKEFEMTSKELLDRLHEMKIPAKSHASMLADAYVEKIRKNLEPEIKARAGQLEDEEAAALAAEQAEEARRKAEEEAARRAAVEKELAEREAARARRAEESHDAEGGSERPQPKKAPAPSAFESLERQIESEKERVEREKAEARARARAEKAAAEVAKKQAVERALRESHSRKGGEKAKAAPRPAPVLGAKKASFDSLLSQIEAEKQRIEAQQAAAPAGRGAKKDAARGKKGKKGAVQIVPELEAQAAAAGEDRYAQMAVQAEKLQRDKVLAEARAAVAAASSGEGEGRRKKRKEKREAEARERAEIEAIERGLDPTLVLDDSVVEIPQGATVAKFAELLGVQPNDVIKRLFMLGQVLTLTQSMADDMIELIADDMGRKVRVVSPEEEYAVVYNDSEGDLKPRPPVVTVMGHVDHGKTSLLDAIRHTGVVAGEAGGITQHIGASVVDIDGRQITFIDTPGHEAFTAMRARGAQVTDVIVLVVAADDGVMPQTIEAINHAKAADVPIVVAVNKIDKPGANPDRVRQELTEYQVIPEEWGGSNMFVEVSAKQKLHIDDLLETILLQADVLELKANPDADASGFVIEANLDKGRGPVATVLVQRGTLRTGDVVVAGTSYGRVRALVNPLGAHVDEARPADPVEILGLNSVPTAGDEFRVFEDERDARKLAEERALRARLAEQETKSHMSLDDLFNRIEAGKQTDLNLIVKADVQGSIEALRDAFGKMDQSEVRINIVHSAVGGITETDVTLAAASDAIIIGFNVRPTGKSRAQAEKEKVDIRLYRVIYQAIEDINAARVGLLSPDIIEEDTGIAEVRETFKVPKVGTIAGCYITEGEINRDDKVRIVRDGTVIFEGSMASLRRFKDDVKSVKQGYECGIGIEKFQDLKVGDTIEGYQVKEVERTE